MGHNRNLADYAHHFDGTNIDLGSGNIETEGVVTYEDVTNVDAIGIVTARAGVRVPDSQTVKMGTGGDLSIYHNGSNSHISNTTGGLYIDENIADGDIFLRADNGSGALTNYLFCDGSSGRVVLSHYGSGKIQTSSTGATVTGTLVSDSVTSELDLSAISASISDTAVDVFVYDTRKDSDGGAWRKRTQHTSWYNETLNTSTRGSRKEFPAVAVIVTETSQITIYDGDDPDLPMWMVFNAGSGNALSYNNGAKSTVMLNGKLANAATGSNQRFRTIDFLSDSHLEYSHTDGRTTFNINISQRNSGAGSFNYGNISGSGLINRDCEDVAMKVLPNAPIDDATGLPVPTIAVGTRDGLSIIKDDGSVIDYTHGSGTYDRTSFVEFLGDDRVAYAWDNDNTPRRFFVTPVRSDDTATVTNTSYPIDTVNTVGYGRPTDQKGVGLYHGHLVGHDQSVAAGMNGSMIAVGDGSDGLNLVDVQAAGEDTFNSRIAFISKDYNTGWQYGNIKGTFLSDNDDTNITGTNIIDNGDFGSNFTNWTIGGDTTPTISSGGAKISTAATIDGYVWQSTSGEAVNGKWIITWTLTANTSGFVGLYINGTQPANGNSYSSGGTLIKDSITASGSHYYDGTITAIEFRHRGGGGGHAIIDNITFKRVDEDRSVYNKGLEVYGTVTKSAVATGAELVAYSGFSASNYLQQPFNSDMEFGTNDYYMSIWAKGGANDQTLMIREHAGSDEDGSILIFQSSGKYNFYSRQGGTAGWTAFSANNATFGNYWSHVMLVRRGGTMYGYVNGKLEGSTSFSGNVSNGDAVITIGRRASNNTQNYSGSLALAKIGQSAPSQEQIKKIYEDEKMLFQENAKCTLYGDGTGIAALAYDNDTELLHVGTSSGRSDFQGLCRINNTTTAVTTAISASDELIAEQ